jgi:hypothetical protein
MQRKKFSTHKAITVLLLTIIIFSLGILIGNYNTSKKFNSVIGLSDSLRLETQGAEVIQGILKENLCENDDVLYLNDDLYTLSERLDYLENLLGADNSMVKEMKKDYFITEARHWTLAKTRAKNCLNNSKKINDTIILYFYGDSESCPRCMEQGAVLTYLRNKYNGMKVYSFDYYADSAVVDVIKKLYGVNNVPAVVINDELYVGYLNSEGVEEFINKQEVMK